MRLLTDIFFCTTIVLLLHAAAGRELIITTIKEDPYIMPKGDQLEGYCMDLLSELARKLGFSYKVHLVEDGAYGRQVDGGNWNGMIGEVMRGKADLAIAPLTLTAARKKVVGMTTPFMQTGISIILRKDVVSGDDGLFSFLAPFSTKTWVGILAAYLGTAACICVVARLSPSEWRQPQTDENGFTLLYSLWYTAGALSLQGAGQHPKALSGRVISATWWLFSLVLLASYFSNLSSPQSPDSSHLKIKGFEDLANQEVMEYGTLGVSSTLAFFNNSKNPTYRRMYEHMERRKSFVPFMAEGIRRAREGNYAFIGESVPLDLAAARHCDLLRAHEVIGMRGYSIAAPLGSPLLKNLSVAILQLSEAGELAYLRSKWWASRCADVGAGLSARRAHNPKGLFMVLAVGLAAGLLLALLELTLVARRSAEEQRKSCCLLLSQELGQRLRTGRGAEENSDKSKP